MDTEAFASMYAQVVNGVAKDESQYVTDEESSREWDILEAQVVSIRAKNPDAVFSVPNEMP